MPGGSALAFAAMTYTVNSAANAGDGVHVFDGESRNSIRGNSIHDNGDNGIENTVGGNLESPPPVIAGAGFVSGTPCANCAVDAHSDNADEDGIFGGTTFANGSGGWSFARAVVGPNVTATATDASGNTSEFSTPLAVPTPTPTPMP